MPALPLRFEFEQLSDIRAPTLLFNGEHDHTDFVDVSKRLEKILPNARHARINGAGGFPIWEFFERVNLEVATFLEDVAGKR